MKTESIIVIGAAAVLLAVVYNKVRKQPTREIPNEVAPGAAGYGWRYFSDGVAIGPDGTYYKEGAAIWSPTGTAGDEVWSVGAMGR